jgi:hypothetical protein
VRIFRSILSPTINAVARTGIDLLETVLGVDESERTGSGDRSRAPVSRMDLHDPSKRRYSAGILLGFCYRRVVLFFYTAIASKNSKSFEPISHWSSCRAFSDCARGIRAVAHLDQGALAESI